MKLKLVQSFSDGKGMNLFSLKDGDSSLYFYFNSQEHQAGMYEVGKGKSSIKMLSNNVLLISIRCDTPVWDFYTC